MLLEKSLVSRLESLCSLKIRDFGCLTEKDEATNDRIGITLQTFEAKTLLQWNLKNNIRGNLNREAYQVLPPCGVERLSLYSMDKG